MKKLLLCSLGLCAMVVLGFVAKEAIFFDSNNPYGDKEIFPEFAKTLPAIETPTFDPTDFGVAKGPLADEEAKRVVSEYLSAELERRGIDPAGFDLVAVSAFTLEKGTIYEFRSNRSSRVIRVRMDRRGIITIL
jgi:hypothetical protein